MALCDQAIFYVPLLAVHFTLCGSMNMFFIPFDPLLFVCPLLSR